MPELAERLKQRQKIAEEDKELFEDVTRISEIKTNRKKDKRTGEELSKNFRGVSYGEERDYLNELILDLYKNNANKFASKKEVFAIFAKAFFTGKSLPLARLIDQTYGKGTFRQIGEDAMSPVDSGFLVITKKGKHYHSFIELKNK